MAIFLNLVLSVIFIVSRSPSLTERFANVLKVLGNRNEREVEYLPFTFGIELINVFLIY
jgi:hypothetical protein